MVYPLPLLRPRYLRAWQVVDIIGFGYAIYYFHVTKFPPGPQKIGYFRYKKQHQGDKHHIH